MESSRYRQSFIISLSSNTTMNRDTYSGCHLRRRAHSGLQSFHHPSGDTSSPDSHSLSLTSTSGLPSEHQSHMQKLSPITESNAKCWERMLALQKEYHCYHSARLDAAAEVVENGVPVECVPVRKFEPLFTETRQEQLSIAI